MPEPTGHKGQETKLERYWQANQDAVNLRRKRITKYDAAAGMTYSPMEYLMQPVDLRADEPEDDWIKSSLREFVRAEFSATPAAEMPKVWTPQVVGKLELSDMFLDDFLTASESVQRILPAPPKSESSEEMARAVFDLLCHPAVGSRKNARLNTADRFVTEMAETIENRSRLLVVLPGFPFKDQNRFRVPFSSDQPDLAEISFMIRLHRLTQALYQVHPFGADVIVLSDGSLYGDIFGVEQDSVAKYFQRLIGYRNRLNLQGTVSILPLKDLIDRTPAEMDGNRRAEQLCLDLEDRLKAIVSRDLDSTAIFATLVAGMKRNMNTRTKFESVNDKECWAMIRLQELDMPKSRRDIWRNFHDMSEGAAYRYAAVNLMLSWLGLVHAFFPDAIRGTVHPKPGQFAVAGVGGAYAWNGIAWSATWPTTIDDLEVLPFSSLADRGAVFQVMFESGLPAFYTGANDGI